jgi:broad specificity phosphatase PhoE
MGELPDLVFLLLRHGELDNSDSNEFKAKLTAEGMREVARFGDYLLDEVAAHAHP